jgi:ABC-2 type transport system ATP-binding protein
MVACDTVDNLRASGGEELLVHAPEAPEGWASGIPGVTVRGRENGHTVLALDEGADDQAILAAALAVSPVREFARRRSSLTELFRHVVSTDTATSTETSTASDAGETAAMTGAAK